MKEIIKNTFVLFTITLVAGLLLGIVYEVTKEPRKKQEELAQKKAYIAVFEKADKFDEIKYDDVKLQKYLSQNGIKASMAKIDNIVTALDKKGKVLGYVITVTDKEGYGGDITLTVGIQNDKTVNGISILSISETAGLGMEAKENKFKNQFKNKKVDRFVYQKEASAKNEIDVISGATITTNAVTNGVNTAIIGFEYLTAGGGADE
ncbi:MAG: RnfABCDGE type electron transport complex subunit G [Lachnospiraceae bacterium]|nr:RnfABCDGE type electron transport complex subunit G [Lachnospiraceae bacterium]